MNFRACREGPLANRRSCRPCRRARWPPPAAELPLAARPPEPPCCHGQIILLKLWRREFEIDPGNQASRLLHG